ncbi:MAG: site-2 protease family protein [Acidobacteriota bacterium]
MIFRLCFINCLLLLITVYSTTMAGAMFEEYGYSFTSFIFLIMNPWALKSGLPFSFWLILILGLHEMGHYWACSRYGVAATFPFFLPGPTIFGTFGAVIKIRGIIPHRNALFDIGMAGPLAGFLASIPALIIGLSQATVSDIPIQEGTVLFGDSILISLLDTLFFLRGGEVALNVNSIFYAGWVGLLATTMNLFPVGQLDGGHICYAISRRFHRVISYVTIFAIATLIMYSLIMRGFSVWVLWFAILIVMRARHPRLLDEEVPLTAGRRWFSIISLAILLLSFMPDPISIQP